MKIELHKENLKLIPDDSWDAFKLGQISVNLSSYTINTPPNKIELIINKKDLIRLLCK